MPPEFCATPRSALACQVGPYAIAFISTGTATWLRSQLQPVLGSECPFSLFYLSVLLTAWLGGTGPAIVSLILGTLSAAHYFVYPPDTLYIVRASSILSLTIYVFVNCVAIGLFRLTDLQRATAERRLGENQLLSQSLRKADERKDEFLALLAHELRNPLAPIRTQLALLERKSDDPRTVIRAREVCQRQIHQLVRLVDDLLDISRFLRGSLRLQRARVDLREAVQVAVEMTEESMQAKSHRFNILMSPTPVWVEGDPVRLTQLTANLLGNAAKYTPNCGRILLQVEQKDDQAMIVVSDNGIGFPLAERERMLEPFTQIDSSRTREYGGLGVGLAIVRQLVQLHGGTLLPESRGPGSGSRFSVSLPIAPPPEPCEEKPGSAWCASDGTAARAAAGDEDHRLSVAANASPQSILIVEDNVDAAESLSELLRLEGMEVEWASDAVAAIQSLQRRVPAFILMDIGLPGMDGYQLAQRIRTQLSRDVVRIVALTGWGGEDDRRATREAGFDHHLVKPVNFSELMDVLRQLGPPVARVPENSCC